MGKKKDLQKQIDEMEQEARNKAMAKHGGNQTVPFDSWFAIRSKHIPAHHHKEILKADFKARNVNDVETMEAFDKALELYGIKLKLK